MGRIIARKVTGPPEAVAPSHTKYVWKLDTLIEELDAADNSVLRQYFYLGSTLVLVKTADASYIPLTTANGSVAGYLDDGGTLLERTYYGPYGFPVTKVGEALVESEGSAISDTILFHRAFYDAAAGLYHMGQRAYHPILGRFLQRDPSPYVSNRALFSAFDGDPVTLIDRSGGHRDWADEGKNLAKLLAGKYWAYAELAESLTSFETTVGEFRTWESDPLAREGRARQASGYALGKEANGLVGAVTTVGTMILPES